MNVSKPHQERVRGRDEPTHGRHCRCTPCKNEDWTQPHLAPCGMHGPSCPPVYDPWPKPDSNQHSTLDEREYLERLFNEDACERLARSNRDYQQSHAEYIVPLAKLLNATRRERDAWAAGKDLGHYEAEARVRSLKEQLEAYERVLREGADGFGLHRSACIEVLAYDGRRDGTEVLARGDGRSEDRTEQGLPTSAAADRPVDRPFDSTVSSPSSLAQSLDAGSNPASRPLCPQCGRSLDGTGTCIRCGGHGGVVSVPASEPGGMTPWRAAAVLDLDKRIRDTSSQESKP